MPAPGGDVTLLLTELREGNREAANRLMPLIYSELRRMAGSYMQRERPGHTLQATALVNEVYMRLARQVPQSRIHGVLGAGVGVVGQDGQPAAGGIHGFAAGISSHFVYGSHSDYGILFIYRSQLDRAEKGQGATIFGQPVRPAL